jgi:hypothetical protein
MLCSTGSRFKCDTGANSSRLILCLEQRVNARNTCEILCRSFGRRRCLTITRILPNNIQQNMINLRGIVLLLFVAIGIGTAGTLTSVMATYKGYPACCCPAGFKADPDQGINNLLPASLGEHVHSYVHCVSLPHRLYENGACCLPKESKYELVSPSERDRVCHDNYDIYTCDKVYNSAL